MVGGHAPPGTRRRRVLVGGYLGAAKVGSEYKYRIINGDKQLFRIDPYARAVTGSVGNAIVVDPAFDWSDGKFQLPAINELVVDELHLGTFHDKEQGIGDKFAETTSKLDHLQRLGVNLIEVMPLAQFPGYSSWGYNPSCVFAVETNYGGPLGFKRFVKAAHQAGIGVVLDVVYNHFGPSDLELWQFDGWSENGQGGGFTSITTGEPKLLGDLLGLTTVALKYGSLFGIMPTCGSKTTTSTGYDSI